MNSDRMYQRSSIGRAIDPAYPTNRAVLVIIPVAGLIGLAIAYWRGVEGWGLLLAAVGAAGTAFGGWALARELSPDDELGAFISMALALAVSLATGHTAVLYIITTMMLVRIVNRTVGLPAKVTDSIAVMALTVWCTLSTGSSLPAIMASVAFAFDATLDPALRHQWIFASVSMLLGALYLITHQPPSVESISAAAPWVRWSLVVIGLIYGALIIGTKQWKSPGDATGLPLRTARVKAGMAIGLLAATGVLFVPPAGSVAGLAVWGILAGAVAGRLISALRPS